MNEPDFSEKQHVSRTFPKCIKVPRAGFEPATTCFHVEKERFSEDLEGFRLFALAKLNLSRETVKHYIRRVKAFLKGKEAITDKDMQTYVMEKKRYCTPDYVSNIISTLKAYFRDYKRLSFMDGYKHPSNPLRIKEEIEPEKVKRFIEAIDNLGVKCELSFWLLLD